MIEFGSDFHYIAPQSSSNKTISSFFPSANYYADGRQALIHLYHTQGWERLWVPEYYCYDVIASLKAAGVVLCFYADYPGNIDDTKSLEIIQRTGNLHQKDAVLRVNYFGMRSWRNTVKISDVAIVEDHTHDVIGEWAINSTADWCIASLRKTIPIPEGGILWSPIGLRLPKAPSLSEKNEDIAIIRWKAMRLKTLYLAGEKVDKRVFRSWFVNTEAFFESSEVCLLDYQSQEYLRLFDIEDWYHKKYENWNLLRSIKKTGIQILEPESVGGYPFSIVFLFDSQSERDKVRHTLIESGVYPAILWDIPSPRNSMAYSISRRMLSIHCDARYSHDEVIQMKLIIESALLF